MTTLQDQYVGVFLDFLRTKGAFERYMHRKNSNVFAGSAALFVNDAFVWTYATEGRAFWLSIHEEWCGLLREAGYYD